MSRTIEEALEVLGVATDSDPETVAHAYRRLARATHPDISPEPDAAHRFAAVAAAYRVVERARNQPAARLGPGAGREPATAPAEPVPSPPWLASSSSRWGRRPVAWPTTVDDVVPFRMALWGSLFAPARPWNGPTILAGPVLVQPYGPDTAPDDAGTGDV